MLVRWVELNAHDEKQQEKEATSHKQRWPFDGLNRSKRSGHPLLSFSQLGGEKSVEQRRQPASEAPDATGRVGSYPHKRNEGISSTWLWGRFLVYKGSNEDQSLLLCVCAHISTQNTLQLWLASLLKNSMNGVSVIATAANKSCNSHRKTSIRVASPWLGTTDVRERYHQNPCNGYERRGKYWPLAWAQEGFSWHFRLSVPSISKDEIVPKFQNPSYNFVVPVDKQTKVRYFRYKSRNQSWRILKVISVIKCQCEC